MSDVMATVTGWWFLFVTMHLVIGTAYSVLTLRSKSQWMGTSDVEMALKAVGWPFYLLGEIVSAIAYARLHRKDKT